MASTEATPLGLAAKEVSERIKTLHSQMGEARRQAEFHDSESARHKSIEQALAGLVLGYKELLGTKASQ